MDFLTITCHSAYNYGAVLQTYGLYKYLKDCGFDGKIIDYQPNYFNKPKTNNLLKKMIRPIIRYPDFKKGKKVFGKFIDNNLILTPRMKNTDDLKNKLENARVYITGSDQVWNCSKGEVGNDDAFFLGFVNKDNDCKKVSYAASIAMNELPDNQKDRYKKLLSDFDNISVREKTGVNIINNLGITNVEQVLDPVYLLETKDWIELINHSKLIEKLKKEKYILVYGFLQQKNVYDYAEKLAKRNKCKVYNVNTLIEDYKLKTDKYFWNVTPEDFLALIYYADSVVTNSFHGLSFSIIFKKSFHLFGKNGNSSSRMFDMVDSIGLSNRIVRNDELLPNNFSYDNAEKELKSKISNSKEFLKQAFNKSEETK